MIAAVLFDIDRTLLDHDAASMASLRAALDAEPAGLDDTGHEQALAEWRRLEDLHYGTYLAGGIELAEQRRRRVAGLLEWLGMPAREEPELDAWFAAFLGGYEERWQAFGDVADTLDALDAQGFPLGVVTNADAAVQRRKLEALGIGARLPAFVASSEHGTAKPSPDIFHAACALLGLAPEQVAYVGDHLDTDARGARDAGLRGIWLDRTSAARTLAEPAGVPVIETLADLAEALS